MSDDLIEHLREKAAGKRNKVGDVWGDWICFEAADRIEALSTLRNLHQGLAIMTAPHLFEASDVARFWERVEKSDGCWAWTGSVLKKDGRGVLSVRNKNVVAPRLSWMIHHGPIPGGLFVCHSCDNPNCVNPGHLWLGTARDNILDASAKGRLRQNQKTHCRRGHPYAGHNLIVRRGSRLCRRCIQDATTRWRRRLTETAKLTALSHPTMKAMEHEG